jgi:predicted metal-dependent hydrolase
MKIDRIVRSRRKTLALIVYSDGSLEVRAPLRLSQAEIQAYVERKAPWILRQREKMASLPASLPRSGYANGSRVWLHGQPLAIEFIHTPARSVALAGERLLIPARLQPKIDAALDRWYRGEARRVIEERAEFYARKHGLKYNGIRISAARLRWGSCGPNNWLNFSYRLVMAPLEVIDYVVVHELVHTVERNHSQAFWAKVAAILPDYGLARRWLKLNGRWLDLAYEADPAVILPAAPRKRVRRQPAR